jgi:hypothetical protein
LDGRERDRPATARQVTGSEIILFKSASEENERETTMEKLRLKSHAFITLPFNAASLTKR